MGYYRLKAVFQSRIEIIPISGCWIWTGNLDKDGYGELKYRYKKYRTHRLAWTLFHGEIPKSLCVLHRCDVPCCVNPDHLFVGTLNDNNKDMAKKGRTATGIKSGQVKYPERRPKGIKHGMAKATEDQVIAMRSTKGESQRALAEKFGLSQTTVGSILRRETWKHI